MRDDPDGLALALDGLAAQARPPDELVIVDAGRRGLRLPDPPPPRLRTVQGGPALPGEARNRGAAAASHPWIAFLDAGTRPTESWLDAFAAASAAHPEARILYGGYVPALKDEWDWAAAACYLGPADAPGASRRPSSASLLVERETWASLGGMRSDLRAGEDLLFFREVAARGVPSAPAPGADVLWQLPRGPLGHFRRLRRYSASTWRTPLASTWQVPVLRMYAASLVLVVLAFVFHVGLLLLLPTAGAARIARNLRRRRRGLAGRLTPARLLRIAVLTLLADLATLLGVLDAQRRPGRAQGEDA